MKNFKHSLLAMIAVAMITSLAAVQAKDLRNTSAIKNLTSHVQAHSISVADNAKKADNESESKNNSKNNEINTSENGTSDNTSDAEENREEAEQAQKEVETIPEAAEKENPDTAYVSLTSGTLNVRETPSEEAPVIDSLDAMDEVKILSNSEGWYTVAYDGGKTGYVSSSTITENKEDAEYNAMHYDNYKKGEVITYGEVANVRTAANKDSEVKTQLEDGTPVVTLWEEGDYIRVAYGSDYEEGYIVNTAVDLTGEWVAKSDVTNKQEEVAEAKAAAKRAEEQAQENSRRAAQAAESSASTSSKTASTFSSINETAKASSSSSRGQAIVNTAMQYLGVPYVWGGTSPSGFDCSGLVQYVCKKNGISVSRTAAAQAGNGTYVSRNNLQPGDLVFFGKGNIPHVGIYIGNGQMIHAPQTGDVVKISSIETAYRINSYAGATRVW